MRLTEMSSALSAGARCLLRYLRRRPTTTTALHLRHPTPVCRTARRHQVVTSLSGARRRAACTRRTPGSCHPARRRGMGASPPCPSRYVLSPRWRLYGSFGDRSAAVARASSPIRRAPRHAGVPWMDLLLSMHSPCNNSFSGPYVLYVVVLLEMHRPFLDFCFFLQNLHL